MPRHRGGGLPDVPSLLLGGRLIISFATDHGRVPCSSDVGVWYRAQLRTDGKAIFVKPNPGVSGTKRAAGAPQLCYHWRSEQPKETRPVW